MQEEEICCKWQSNLYNELRRDYLVDLFQLYNFNHTERKCYHTGCGIWLGGVKVLMKLWAINVDGAARQLAFLPTLGRVICCTHSLNVSK